MLELVNKLIDGMIAGVDYFAEMLGALGELQIPILSTLWKALTGNSLTFLDVIAFVIAIPVTLVYRIVEGSYPGDQLTRAIGSTASAVWNRVEGIASAVVGVLSGIFTAITDAQGISSNWADSKPVVLTTLIGIVLAIGQSFVLILGDVLQPDVFVIASSILALLLAVLNAIPLVPPEVTSALGTCFSPALLWCYYEEFKPQQTLETAKLSFAANVVGTFATIINPIKFAPAEAIVPYVAPIADVACAVAAAGLTIGATVKGWDPGDVPTALPEAEEPMPTGAHRVYMPAILQGR